jgi:hypothetical protein
MERFPRKKGPRVVGLDAKIVFGVWVSMSKISDIGNTAMLSGPNGDELVATELVERGTQWHAL